MRSRRCWHRGRRWTRGGAARRLLPVCRDAGDALVALPECQPAWTGAAAASSSPLVHRRLAALPRSVCRCISAGSRSRPRSCSTRADRPLGNALAARGGRAVLQPARRRGARPAGDLAFEQGHFEEAQAWWRYLVDDAPDRLLYPHRGLTWRACRPSRYRIASPATLAGPGRSLSGCAGVIPGACHLAGRTGYTWRSCKKRWPRSANILRLPARKPVRPRRGATRNGVVPSCPPRALWEEWAHLRVPLPPVIGPRARGPITPPSRRARSSWQGPAGVVSYHLRTARS